MIGKGISTKESDPCGALSLLVKFFGFNPIPPKWTFILTGANIEKKKSARKRCRAEIYAE